MPEPTSRDGVITRAVGGERLLRLDQVSGEVRAGDRFLLCSDGLYNALDVQAVIRALAIGGPAWPRTPAAIAQICPRALGESASGRHHRLDDRRF